MRRLFSVCVIGAVILVGTSAIAQAQGSCAKIKDGTIKGSNGMVLTTGFDQWGYNYQAHMFNGLYENFTRPATVVTEGTENLVMKWSDEWLSNLDCNGDHKLDRGGLSDISKGWLTNHFEGDYLGTDEELHHYVYFAKIAYVGAAPVGTVDPWGGDVADGGKRIWGLYAILEEIQTDEFGEYGGRLKFVNKITGPGLGRY